MFSKELTLIKKKHTKVIFHNILQGRKQGGHTGGGLLKFSKSICFTTLPPSKNLPHAPLPISVYALYFVL